MNLEKEEKEIDFAWALSFAPDYLIKEWSKEDGYSEDNIDWDAIVEAETTIEQNIGKILKETFGITWVRPDGHGSYDELVGGCGAPLSVVKKLIDGGEDTGSNDEHWIAYSTTSGTLSDDTINKYLPHVDYATIEFFGFEDLELEEEAA